MKELSPSKAADAELRGQFVSETAKVELQELQRHFARGVVLVVGENLDLIDVAMAMFRDEKDQVSQWMAANQICNASIEHAKDWQQRDPLLWAVVIAPWVLVQEHLEASTQQPPLGWKTKKPS